MTGIGRMTKDDMARHIKSGDTVMVIAGADKGKTGRVLRVLTGQGPRGRRRHQPRVEARAARASATRRAAASRRTRRST